MIKRYRHPELDSGSHHNRLFLINYEIPDQVRNDEKTNYYKLQIINFFIKNRKPLSECLRVFQLTNQKINYDVNELHR